MSNGLLIIIKF